MATNNEKKRPLVTSEQRRKLRFLSCAFEVAGAQHPASIVRRFGFKFSALKKTFLQPMAIAAVPAELRSWQLLKNWFNDTGSVVGAEAAQEEVSERGDVEIKLSESEERILSHGVGFDPPKALKKIKKTAREQKSFRIKFWAALNRAMSAYFKIEVTCPTGWLRFDCEPVKVAKFVFNVGLSLALKNPLPPNPWSVSDEESLSLLRDYLPEIAIDSLKDLEFAVVMSQMKRCMPLLPAADVSAAKEKHKQCVQKTPCDPPSEHLMWIRRISKWIFRPLKGREWTVKDALFSESATFDNKREHGGGKGEIRCSGCTECESQGKYHDKEKAWESFMVDDLCHARVCAVNSNMKARIVTAHPAPLNFFRPLQQLLWSRLKQVPVFRYTGAMPDMASMQPFIPEEGYVFNSADYSQATDGINPQSTIAALSEVFKIVDRPRDLDEYEWDCYQSQAKATITASTLHYSLFDQVKQNYGQMMGHLLSFPILCIINASIWAETMWESSELLLLELASIFKGQKDYPLRINGDDLLCKMRAEVTGKFAQMVRKNGWELSVGKSYLHPSIGCINSQFFDFSGRVQIADKYKFGGLQKEATPDAFASWVYQWKKPEEVEDFFIFFKPFILREFGHPRVLNLLRYFPGELQARVYSHFGPLTYRDFHHWQNYVYEQTARLKEEDLLEEIFLRENKIFLGKTEQGWVEEKAIRQKEEKDWEKERERLYQLAAKFGILTFFSRDHRYNTPLPGWVEHCDSMLTADREFWSFVSKWRETRLAVEEYQKEKKGSRFLKWRWTEKRRKIREFQEWKLGMEERTPRVWNKSEKGRFVVRDSREFFYPHWGRELERRGFSLEELRQGYNSTGSFVWSDDGRVCHVVTRSQSEGWILGGALDEQVSRPGESSLISSEIRLLLTVHE